MDYRIFIVEDDRGIAEGITEQMEQWGLEAKPVLDFHNVMGEFAEYQPHLVLMDISLPFMSKKRSCFSETVNTTSARSPGFRNTFR